MSRLTTEERQTMIIDEAIKIIHSGGYEALSIREIAKQVKISEPAIYRHFLNKEDIILGILNRMLEFDKLLNKNIAAAKSAKQKIRQFVLFHFEFLENNPEMTSVLFSEEMYNQSEILKKKLVFIIQKRKQLLKVILDDAKNSGELIDVDNFELMSIILGTIRIIVMEWRLSNFSFQLTDRGKSMLKILDKLILL
ncbi:MAG: TetR/AcrR family transcriptional regulator [Ignavibacteriota bacterium]|nr:TetR/AcrR family transcriptional regulator [Ignavibacteriota bacterium]MBW7869284.1 TetR/AcrR family transcriptional regulator [Brumimicrobium sp.]MCO6446495.1 TetR/AcrR family transcriptional regulator [Ignavibacterium album]MCZ2267916.1 TetR/AcrR family transcriptional regulator [Ignavibacteriales bacterium]MEB2297544.1 TetR/AcrR family transcriptional regulator [Ignavibacteria bacterium]HOJ06424.1 TetR/AcrR family transcriptional regulator [Ignavibacteriaceae bacterium]